jgi:hypothetical protein
MRLHTGTERVLVLPDLQIPYEHPDALQFCTEVHEAIDATEVLNIGDEVDQMAMSRFDPDPDADSAGVELTKAIAQLQGWYDTFPDVKVCHSNHTQRVYKQAFVSGIAEAYIRPVNEWIGAPDGWRWEDVWEIDGVRYEHGDAQGGMYAARNLALKNRVSTVIGHHHSHGGVAYIANHTTTIFGMNVGCLVDVKARAFRYAKLMPFKPTLGCGVVLHGVPYFIPMLTDADGRYTGELVI